MNNIKIEKASPSDAYGIQSLTIESSREMYKLCGWTEEEINNHFPLEKAQKAAEGLEKGIANFTDDNILLVAKMTDDNNEGKVVGCCFAEKHEDKNTIEALYVMPEFKGAGLAKELYDKAHGLLDKNKDTYLDVFSLNSRGVGFYKKQGFTETGKKTFDERFKGSNGEMLEITEMILLV
jgi:ribosomal protein S18 acetylase RimI-like enzyme